MVYLTLNRLKVGMKVGRSIYYGQSSLPLLIEGQILTQSIIKKLDDRSVSGVYIQSDLFKDIDMNSERCISDDVKIKMNNEIKIIYESILQRGTLDKTIEKRISKLADTLIKQVLSKDQCLLNVIDIKSYDNYTYSHSINVGILAVLIGVRLGYSNIELSNIATAGFLHDIGKIDVPIEIVNKPKALTNEEFEEMKKHPQYAVSKLTNLLQIPYSVLVGIESHHEKYDGTGYPYSQLGNSISEFGRVLAIADVYDAITSSRSYRKAWSPDKAVEYMMTNTFTHFDPKLIDEFLKIVLAYPVGTIVELSDGSIGVVIKNNPEFTLRPSIRIIMPSEKRGQDIELSHDNKYLNVTVIGSISDKEVLPEGLFDWLFNIN